LSRHFRRAQCNPATLRNKSGTKGNEKEEEDLVAEAAAVVTVVDAPTAMAMAEVGQREYFQ
jgi:hypothetical protein